MQEDSFNFFLVSFIEQNGTIAVGEKFKIQPRYQLFMIPCIAIEIDRGYYARWFCFPFETRTLNFRLHTLLYFHISENLFKQSPNVFIHFLEDCKQTVINKLHRGLITIILEIKAILEHRLGKRIGLTNNKPFNIDAMTGF